MADEGVFFAGRLTACLPVSLGPERPAALGADMTYEIIILEK